MLACVDVDYRDAEGIAVAACVLFRDWPAEHAEQEATATLSAVGEYVPGAFFKRELPCLLRVIQQISPTPKLIIIDGYVWLDDAQKPGLGAHLYDALQRRLPVVGVAKNKFHSATQAAQVFRGESHKPLYVTAAGIELSEAVAGIQAMAGPYRIPTLLRRVDQLCRAQPSPPAS